MILLKISDISLPEVYTSSSDFRFFCKWFETALQRIKYDTENLLDLYDPLRCPAHLLWMLADTIGFKYDDRLPVAFNRLVLLYFMSMIRHKGSKDGVTLAAEVNLAQFSILMRAYQGYTDDNGNEIEPNDILQNRLEDTSIPVNSVYVTPHTEEGYIDVVYFADRKPINACIEYVRPLGMYVFEHAGVRYDSRTKISIDARLANSRDLNTSIGPTHVGHYRRDDYARLQRSDDDIRNPVYYRNVDAENSPNPEINPGYRSLYSLQLCNNEHIVRSLIKDSTIFSLGYGPQDIGTYYADDYADYRYQDNYSNRPDITDPSKAYNLRYDKSAENALGRDVHTLHNNSAKDILHPQPAVNPVMMSVGDAISAQQTLTSDESEI